MKPANFPGRKLARKIAAQYGGSSRNVPNTELEHARTVRTKKNRSTVM